MMVGSATRVSRNGGAFDPLGDVATNSGMAGHQSRHELVNSKLHELVSAKLGKWAVQREASDFKGYSDTRPDMTIQAGIVSDAFYIGDTKDFDSLGADPAKLAAPGRQAGAHVGFGNTNPLARERVLGRRPGASATASGRFDSATGRGQITEKSGQYTRALDLGMW